MKEYTQSKISKLNWYELELPCVITSRGVAIAEIFKSKKKLDYVGNVSVTDVRANTVARRESLQSKIELGVNRLAIYKSAGCSGGKDIESEIDLYIKKP